VRERWAGEEIMTPWGSSRAGAKVEPVLGVRGAVLVLVWCVGGVVVVVVVGVGERRQHRVDNAEAREDQFLVGEVHCSLQ